MRSLAMIIGAVVVVAAVAGLQAQSPSPVARQDWALVRSVSNELSGTMEFVVVPVRRQRDRAYYETIATTICGPRAACMVFFWTDRRHVPTSAWMSGPGLSRMTAHYERSPTYDAPVLSLACWLYPSKAEAEGDKCFYLPGAKTPWPK